MQNVIKTLVVVCSLAFGSAQAVTVGLDYAQKDKVETTQENTVIGLAVSNKIADGLAKGVTAEVRVEDEIVKGITPKKHEGLIQLKGSRDLYSFKAVVPVTLYGAGAVGLKSKVDNSFKYYLVAVGAKTTVAGVGLDLASRLRSPFGEGVNGTGPKYRTVEHSVSASYALSKVNTVSVKYAKERGDSNYNTVGLGIKHTF